MSSVPTSVSSALLKKSAIPFFSIKRRPSAPSVSRSRLPISQTNTGEGYPGGSSPAISMFVHDPPDQSPEISPGKTPTEFPPAPNYEPTTVPPEVRSAVPPPSFDPIGPVPQEVPNDPPPGSPGPNPGPEFPGPPLPSPPMPDIPMPKPEVPPPGGPDIVPPRPPEIDPPPTGPPDIVPPPSTPPDVPLVF